MGTSSHPWPMACDLPFCGARAPPAPRVPRPSWRRQAQTVSATVAALLQSLRLVGAAERRARLRRATTGQLRVLGAGLRLRVAGAREALLERIEEALRQDGVRAQQGWPSNLILSSPFEGQSCSEFERVIRERLSCSELKSASGKLPKASKSGCGPGLCKVLRLSTEGRKAWSHVTHHEGAWKRSRHV